MVFPVEAERNIGYARLNGIVGIYNTDWTVLKMSGTAESGRRLTGCEGGCDGGVRPLPAVQLPARKRSLHERQCVSHTLTNFPRHSAYY
jgi:hypothetical protein